MSRVYTTSLAIALAYILTVQTDFRLALAWPWSLALEPGLGAWPWSLALEPGLGAWPMPGNLGSLQVVA